MKRTSNTPEPHEIAEEKIQNYRKQQEKCRRELNRFDVCLMAAICPICGKDLYLDRKKPKKWYIRLTQYSCGKVRCPSGCKLIHPEIGDVSNPKKTQYEGCINYDICKAHLELTKYAF